MFRPKIYLTSCHTFAKNSSPSSVTAPECLLHVTREIIVNDDHETVQDVYLRVLLAVAVCIKSSSSLMWSYIRDDGSGKMSIRDELWQKPPKQQQGV